MPRLYFILPLVLSAMTLAPNAPAQCDLVDEDFAAIPLGTTLNSLPGWRDHTIQSHIEIGLNPCNGTPAIVLDRPVGIAERRLNNLPTPEAFRIKCEVAVWSDGNFRIVCPAIIQGPLITGDTRMLAFFEVTNGANLLRSEDGAHALPVVPGQCVSMELEIDVFGLCRLIYDGEVLFDFPWPSDLAPGPCSSPESFAFLNTELTYNVGMVIDNVCVSSPDWSRYCSTTTNSTGESARIGAFGSGSVAADDLELHVTDLPPNTFGYFIVGTARGLVANPGGSQGNLCVTGAIGRFQQILQSSSSGVVQMPVDWSALPWLGGAPAIVLPGQTWNFQYYHRDRINSSPVTNFSDGLSITLAP